MSAYVPSEVEGVGRVDIVRFAGGGGCGVDFGGC